MNVEFFYGYSIYKSNTVSDRELCDFIGLDTYKALFTLHPELYIDFTYPMTPSKHKLSEIKNFLSLHSELNGQQLKSYFVIYFFEGENYKNKNHIIDLIDCNSPLLIPCVSDNVRALWILIVFIVTILVVYVLVFHIWPSFYEYRCAFTKTYGSPLEWLERPWI